MPPHPREYPGVRAVAADSSDEIVIRGPRLLLRPLQPADIEAEWQEMVTAGPMSVARLPDEARFKDRLRRSGRLQDGWLDLAIDAGGTAVGRIQSYLPPGRPLAAGTFEIGLGLREHARGRGYGGEALTLLAGWLFEHAAADVVQGATDPSNAAMLAVLRRTGWQPAGPLTELDRTWILYRMTRQQWQAGRESEGPASPARGRAAQ